MTTERLTTELDDILRAGDIIRRGGLVAFPTETVYGLGANALDAEAVSSVYAAKGRPSDNPMIVHIAEKSELDDLIRGGLESLTEDARRTMDAFWPGPLTIIFPKSDAVPDATTGGLDTVAVRMPSNRAAYMLIAASLRPIAAPSANVSGRPSPTTAEDVLEDMDGRIDAIIMGEQCDVGIESTVLDLTGEVPTILRPGIITKEELTEALGREVVYYKSLLEKPAETADPEDGVADTEFKPKSPGMKYRHYSPKAKVRLIEGSREEFVAKAKELGVEAIRNGLKPAVLDYREDEHAAAHDLFADLREFDRQGYDLILIRTLEESGLGFSVMNRMLKSAGYDIVK
ncbi:MAG: threonylcarbamoyl-AMP synthase [Mogibacterium sp.]|nr:threonylcarbamoyl-AMP synthase [Mogibacterium sp.]